MSFFQGNKAKAPQNESRILSTMYQDLDNLDFISSPDSEQFGDNEYNDAPIKKLKTEKASNSNKSQVILIDDSDIPAVDTMKRDKSNKQSGFTNTQVNVQKPIFQNHQTSMSNISGGFSPEYPQSQITKNFTPSYQIPSHYRPHPPTNISPTNAYYTGNSYPQFNRPPFPQSQENISKLQFRPGPPNSQMINLRPSEPQISLKQAQMNSTGRPQGGLFEPEQLAKLRTPSDNMNIEKNIPPPKLAVNELAKRAAIAKKTTKGRPMETENGLKNTWIQTQGDDELREKANEKSNSDPMRKGAAINTNFAEKVSSVEIPKANEVVLEKISPSEESLLKISPNQKVSSANKGIKKGGLGPSVPVFSKQRNEEVNNQEVSVNKAREKKQRREKNISLFKRSSNQELHELIRKELNDSDEDEIESESTLNEMIVRYSNRHKNMILPTLRLHEYFEPIDPARQKPEEYPNNYREFFSKNK